jgi:hypothetical protein
VPPSLTEGAADVAIADWDAAAVGDAAALWEGDEAAEGATCWSSMTGAHSPVGKPSIPQIRPFSVRTPVIDRSTW